MPFPFKWQELNPGQRLVVGACTGVFLGATILTIMAMSKEKYVSLNSSIEPGKIIAKLDAIEQPYKTKGDEILVPVSQKGIIRSWLEKEQEVEVKLKKQQTPKESEMMMDINILMPKSTFDWGSTKSFADTYGKYYNRIRFKGCEDDFYCWHKHYYY